MGILSRISKVLEANLNAVVDRAEDPAKMLDQAIEDMKKGRAEAHNAIVEAKTQRKLLEKKREKSVGEAQELEKKAMLALKANDEALARKLLQMRITAEHRAEMEGSAISEQDAQVAQLEVAEKELERRLAEMPAKRAALLARQSAAQAKGARVGANNKMQESVSAALEAFERMEEKVTRAEVEAEVLADTNPRLLDTGKLDQMEADEALAALKVKYQAQLTAGAAAKGTKQAAAPVDPLEDSLAALKAKLRGDG